MNHQGLTILKPFIGLIFLGGISTLKAQDPYPRWQNFSNGKIVESLAQEDSLIWCGTREGGLIKLNKKTGQKTFYNSANSKLPGNHVNAIAVDEKGNKWIGTPYGLARLQSGNWEVFTPANSSLIDTNVINIAIDGYGNKWLQMDASLVRLQDNELEIFNSANNSFPVQYPQAIATDTAGYTWIANQQKLAKYQSGKWRVVDSSFGIPHPKFMKFDKSNDLWIGHHGGPYHSNKVLTRFDFEADSFWHYHEEDFTGENYGPEDPVIHEHDFFGHIRDVAFDDSGRAWLGFMSGLAVGKEGEWALYGDSSINPGGNPQPSFRNIPADFAANALLSEEGNIWVGHFYRGKVFKFNGNSCSPFDLRRYPYWQNGIARVNSDDSGVAWITTHKQSPLIKYEGNKISVVKPDKFSFNQVYAVSIDQNGNKWLSTDTGLVKYNDRQWKRYAYPVDFFTAYYSMVIDGSNHIWMVDRKKGVYRFDGKAWQHFDTLNSLMQSFYNTALQISGNGDVWLIQLSEYSKYISGERKILRFNGQKWDSYFLKDTQLAKEPIVDITMLEKGKLIFRFDESGYYYFDQGRLKPYEFPIDSLKSYDIHFFSIDQKGNFWMGTNQGLLKHTGSQKQLYTPNNSGLPGKDIWNFSIGPSGNKWIFTQSGVVRFANEE